MSRYRVSIEKSHKMLQHAFDRGLRIRPSRTAGVWLVSSATQKGVWYRVTKNSCPCQGFQKWGYCSHFILVRWFFTLCEQDVAIERWTEEEVDAREVAYTGPYHFADPDIYRQGL